MMRGQAGSETGIGRKAYHVWHVWFITVRGQLEIRAALEWASSFSSLSSLDPEIPLTKEGSGASSAEGAVIVFQDLGHHFPDFSSSPSWWVTFGFSLSSSPCFMSCTRHRSRWMSSGLRWVQKDVSLALEDIKWGTEGRRKPVVKEKKPAGDTIYLEGRALMHFFFLLLLYLSKACNWWLSTLTFQAGG